MANLADYVLDNGIAALNTGATRLDLCSKVEITAILKGTDNADTHEQN